MLLFAYASNMDVDHFATMVPSARKAGIARLPGYIFTFSLSADDQSTKANILPSTDALAEVWGVLIEYNDAERDNFYYADGDLELTEVNVFDEQGEMHKAEVFITKPHAVNTFLLPYDWYHAKVISIARQAGLPESYVNALALLDSKVDHDEKRRTRRLGRL